jgi:hypothetical protein
MNVTDKTFGRQYKGVQQKICRKASGRNSNQIILLIGPKIMAAYTIAILLVSCDYSKDKLIIQNNSKKEICYQTLVSNKANHVFYQVSAGGEIKAGSYNSPLVRQDIFTVIENSSSDKKLYVVFHDCNDKEYVYKHINSIVFDKRYIIKSFYKKDLDSLQWVIKYE